MPNARARRLLAIQRALLACCEALAPELVIGLGGFARRRARAALPASLRVAGVLHPSPASPKANRGWAEQAERELRALGVSVPR